MAADVQRAGTPGAVVFLLLLLAHDKPALCTPLAFLLLLQGWGVLS